MRRTREVSGLAGLLGLFAGCSSSWQQYDSPNYTEWDPRKKVQIRDYFLIDDGDDIYDPTYDRWEDADGKSVDPMKDQSFVDYLKLKAIDAKSLKDKRVHISALADYITAHTDTVNALQQDKTGDSAWTLYLNLAKAAHTLNISTDYDSEFYKSVTAFAGIAGCHIALGMAEASAVSGDIDAMRARMGAAVLCASEQQYTDETFYERAREMKLTGYRAAMDAIVDKYSKNGDMSAMLDELQEVYELAKGEGMINEVGNELEEAAMSGFRRALDHVLQDSEVKAQLMSGSVELLNERVERIVKTVLDSAVGDEIAKLALSALRVGYIRAIDSVEEKEAAAGDLDAMNAKLDAILAGAEKAKILNVVGERLWEVRNAGYVAAITKVKDGEAARGDVEEAESKLNAIYQSAKAYKVLDGLRSYISEVRRLAKKNARE